MRLIFAGTPPFAAAALAALADAGHDIPLVLTQPDRPAGRGMKLAPSAVKREAETRGLDVAQPVSLKTGEAQARLRDARAEIMVVAAYGLILPQAVLDMPPRGCLNIHASLLPRWRGAAPIQRALLAGDAETGITIMQMDAGLDTGAMLLKTRMPIRDTDTAGSLHDRLMAQGASAIVEALSRLDELVPESQAPDLATYAAKLSKEEARLDWARPATELARAVRAYNPAPGAWTLFAGAPLKLWSARPAGPDSPRAEPGTVLAVGDELVVATGEGGLAVSELQPAGGRRMAAAAFCAGHMPAAGVRLG
ncbi:MAG: methionyl-tRNA formyltransferase [Thiobacillus sp.]|nr:methionyl-tRNA formyltransferase [Thiobacillus sp.]